MPSFTAGTQTDKSFEELCEAGCDDASYSSLDGVWHADFDRESHSLEAAVKSAVSDIESVEGIRVAFLERVEPPERDRCNG